MTGSGSLSSTERGEHTPGIVERLRPSDELCPFCGHDPYHYVDIGVGMDRAAVNCCELGIGLFRDGDELLVREVALRAEAAALISELVGALEGLLAGLGPGGYVLPAGAQATSKARAVAAKARGGAE